MGVLLRAGLPNMGMGQGRNRLGAVFAAKANRHHGRAVVPGVPGHLRAWAGLLSSRAPSLLPVPKEEMCPRGAEGSKAGTCLCTSIPVVGISWGAEVVAASLSPPLQPPLALAPVGFVGWGAAGRARWGLTLRRGDAPEPAVIAAW